MLTLDALARFQVRFETGARTITGLADEVVWKKLKGAYWRWGSTAVAISTTGILTSIFLGDPFCITTSAILVLLLFFAFLWRSTAIEDAHIHLYDLPVEDVKNYNYFFEEWLASYGLVRNDLISGRFWTINQIFENHKNGRIIADLTFRKEGEERKSYTVEVKDGALVVFGADGKLIPAVKDYQLPKLFMYEIPTGEETSEGSLQGETVKEVNELYTVLGV